MVLLVVTIPTAAVAHVAGVSLGSSLADGGVKMRKDLPNIHKITAAVNKSYLQENHLVCKPRNPKPILLDL